MYLGVEIRRTAAGSRGSSGREREVTKGEKTNTIYVVGGPRSLIFHYKK